jgi:hypothetical protein
MIFECTRCQKTFDNKTHYNKHLGRKIQCKEIINKKLDEDVNDKLDISNPTLDTLNVGSNTTSSSQYLGGIHIQNNIFINSKENGYKCLICNIIYKHSQTLSNHKRLKHPNYDTDIENINYNQNEKSEIDKSELDKFKELFMTQIKKLEEKNKELDNKNKQLELLVKTSKSKNNTKNITNNNTTNTNNGTINNINIVQFGREDSSLLNKEEISKILYERGVDGLLASIEVFHFNNRLPQYKNIRLTNLKSKYIDIHNGTKWIKENQDKVLNDTLENHTYHLQTICDDTGNSKRIKNSVKNIINDYSEVNKLDTEDKKLTNNKKTIKNISDKKDDVKLFIYNNSKLEEITQTEIIDV